MGSPVCPLGASAVTLAGFSGTDLGCGEISQRPEGTGGSPGGWGVSWFMTKNQEVEDASADKGAWGHPGTAFLPSLRTTYT